MTDKPSPILLDGGMGQELIKRGATTEGGIWAASALYDFPEIVQAIHEDYIRAGADVITTNTYGTTRTRLRSIGMGDRLEELVRTAGTLAIQARQTTEQNHIKIATSLPPLENSYLSEFQLSFDEMVVEYRELMDLLDPYVDIFLAETLATTLEARAVLTAAQGRNKPVWIAFTLKDHGSTQLRSGETIPEAIKSLSGFAVDAVLLNCCTPDSIDVSLPQLQSAGIPFGGYANGFVEIPDTWISEVGVDDLEIREDLSPDIYATHVQKWLRAGAGIVGGCCETGPDHIRALRDLIEQVT